MDIIKVIANEQGSQVVSARDLHKFLITEAKGGQIGEDYSNWIKRNIEYCRLEKGFDYDVIEYDYRGAEISESDNQQVRVYKREYILTLDSAKEISIVQNNDKGREARQYFIACEKKFREQAKPVSQIDLLIQSAIALKENQERTERLEKQQQENENRLLQLEAKNQTRPECYTVAGYASLINKPINLALAKIIGIEAKKICKASEWAIDKTHDPRWGKINVYPLDAIRTAFQIVLARKAI